MRTLQGSFVVFAITAAMALAASEKADGGSYILRGRVNGTASVAPDGIVGWMNTSEYGSDTFRWNDVNKEYEIYDGASGQFVGEFILTKPNGPPPPDYFVQYYDRFGQPDGTGTWDKAS